MWSKTTRPGPAEYRIAGSMGSQVDSTRRSHSAVPFGTEARANTTINHEESKGPGDTRGHSSVSRQVESTRPSAARAHFGTSTREHGSIMYSAFTYKPS